MWPYYFMGIGSILFRDYLQTKYLTFGHILEATSDNFHDDPKMRLNKSINPFTISETIDAPYVLGLTEVGTLKVLSHFNPNLLLDSLTSLASPGEEKLYRKQLLTTIANEKYKLRLDENIIEKPRKIHFSFGESFAPDFLLFYIIKFAGLSSASLLVKDIPEEVLNLSKRLSLNFYEKINPKIVRFVPRELRCDYINNLVSAGIEPYSKDDWGEFFTIRNLLNNFHK